MRRRMAGLWFASFAGAFTLVTAQEAFADGGPASAAVHHDMYRQDTGRSGYSPEPLVTPLSLVWKHTTSAIKNSSASAVYSNGLVYFGNGHTLHALNAGDGTETWSFDGDGVFNASPDIVGGSVYIGTLNSQFYKLDAATGKKIWAKKLNGALRSSPLVADNVVYVGSDDNFCYALDASTGNSIWTVPTNGSVSAPPALTDDKQVLFTSMDNSIRGISSVNGRVLWNTMVPTDPTISPPVYSGNSVYLGSGNRLYSLLPRTGSERWKVLLPSEIVTPCAVGLSTVYFMTADNTVRAIDDRGHALWNSKLDYPTSAPPLLAGTTLIVGTNHGMIYALDTQNGKRLWQYIVQSVGTDTQAKAPFANITTAPVSQNGALYILSDDGTLSAFRTDAVDKAPPQVTNMYPAPGSTVGGIRIPYNALIQDEGSGINPSTVTLSVDGITIKQGVYSSGVNGLHIVIKSAAAADQVPRLSDGTHQAILTATDWRGNTASQTWGFTVDNTFNPPELAAPAPNQDYSTIIVPPDHTLAPEGPTEPSPKRSRNSGVPPPPPL